MNTEEGSAGRVFHGFQVKIRPTAEGVSPPFSRSHSVLKLEDAEMSMTERSTRFVSYNPATEEAVNEYPAHTPDEAHARIELASEAWDSWRFRPVRERAQLMQKLGDQLRSNSESFARLAVLEMGKPLKQARAEIEKCALLCDYYAHHGADGLNPVEVTGNTARRSVVRFDPLGGVLAVMPWNFPFWQVLRFAVPALLAGNMGILKHSTNVLGCAAAIENAFQQAGFPENVFSSLNLDRREISSLIACPFVRAVTLTGSEAAGIAVAEAAGRNLKKCVLELGGSDPFIVLEDADLPLAIQKAIESRIINNGQSCIAAKRFLVHRKVHQEFIDGMVAGLEALKVGDPMDESTQLGPLAREDLRATLEEQVQASLAEGAKLCTGGNSLDRPGWFYAPTLLADVGVECTVFREETFGPVAAVTAFNNVDEAIELANHSEFGLGASIWTADVARAESLAEQIESGSVFINDFTKSDPTLPFGGVKRSGFGRELGTFGLREFVNVKTVWTGGKSPASS